MPTSAASSSDVPLALIVGASRGLGLGLAREYVGRGWHVVATVRGAPTADLSELARAADGRLEIETLDVTSEAGIAALRARLAARRFKLVFVNAGIARGPGDSVAEISTQGFADILITNALSPLRILEAFHTQVVPEAAMVVMSSHLGSVAGNTSGGWEVYRSSKAALNTLMRSFAVRHARAGLTLLVMAPGWVRTDMGGANAALDVATSTRGMADVIDSHLGVQGLAYVDYSGATVPW